jgi:hypothetical protein
VNHATERGCYPTHALVNAPVRAAPDASKAFAVGRDASDFAVGVVLEPLVFLVMAKDCNR